MTWHKLCVLCLVINILHYPCNFSRRYNYLLLNMLALVTITNPENIRHWQIAKMYGQSKGDNPVMCCVWTFIKIMQNICFNLKNPKHLMAMLYLSKTSWSTRLKLWADFSFCLILLHCFCNKRNRQYN